MISDYIETERGTILHNGREYFSATWLAELHIPTFAKTRAGVYKTAARENWPEIHVPGRGAKDGVKYFLVPEKLLQKINSIMPIENNSKHYPVSKAPPLKLVTGSGQHNSLSVQSHSNNDMRIKDFLPLPKYDLQLTTEGHDHVIHSEQIVDYLAFKKEWLEMSLDVRNNCLALITIKDDSMEPTLRSDDLILTDVSKSHLENNSLYVLQLNNELIVKRIQKKMNGNVIVKSDNPNYESEELDELAAQSLHIIGKVIWYGRRI